VQVAQRLGTVTIPSEARGGDGGWTQAMWALGVAMVLGDVFCGLNDHMPWTKQLLSNT
jgi:hypothetical protein